MLYEWACAERFLIIRVFKLILQLMEQLLWLSICRHLFTLTQPSFSFDNSVCILAGFHWTWQNHTFLAFALKHPINFTGWWFTVIM